jgi:hypothetical protein
VNAPQHSRPLRHGALAAVLAVPLILVLLQYIQGGLFEGLGLAPLFLIFGLVVPAPAMLLPGAPWVLWLRRRRWLNAINVCIGAMISGAIAMAAFVFLLSASGGREVAIGGAAAGLLSGVIFCLVSGVRIWRLKC